jgi:hypothetical protein
MAGYKMSFCNINQLNLKLNEDWHIRKIFSIR